MSSFISSVSHEANRNDHVAKPSSSSTQLVEAIQIEHALSFTQALKLYPKAIGWSMFVSTGVIMLAFDPQLLGNLYATPQFARDFGDLYNGRVEQHR